MAFMAVVLFGPPISGILIPQAAGQVSTSTGQTITLSVNQVITLTLSTSTLGLGSLTPGTAVSATSSATVTTNSATGWSLRINRASATSTIASGTIAFPDATQWNGSNATSSNFIGANMHFRVFQSGTTAGLYNSTLWGPNDTDGTGNSMYAGFPTASSSYVATTSTYSGANQVVVMKVRADAPGTQQATNYTGNITITAISNP